MFIDINPYLQSSNYTYLYIYSPISFLTKWCLIISTEKLNNLAAYIQFNVLIRIQQLVSFKNKIPEVESIDITRLKWISSKESDKQNWQQRKFPKSFLGND